MSDDRKQIKRALISVYDKTGLEELARPLDSAGVEIVSTGSTAAKIADLGINVTPVEALTGFPECLEGRVKTLHPRVHAGILADTRKPDHLQQLEDLEIEAFQLVVVNLYPFRETVASGADFDGCVEQIDIGGPSMVRAAAKNHPSVAVVVDPARYGDIAQAIEQGGFDLAQRRQLAATAFKHTAEYDVAVSGWFAQQLADDSVNSSNAVDRKSTRLNSSHVSSSYGVFCLCVFAPCAVASFPTRRSSDLVVVDPARYGDIAQAIEQGGFDLAQRRQLAATAFKHTAEYDVAVSGWFAQQLADDSVNSSNA